MKLFIFILMIFLVSGLIIINNYDLHITNQDDLKVFSGKYEEWAGESYDNFFKITGYISKMDWIPKT